MSGQALTALTLREQVAGLASGALDGAELLGATLDGLDGRARGLGATAAVFGDEAARMLAPAAMGGLHGAPVVVKDMFALPWRAPQDGADRPVAELPAGASGVYRALARAGAVVPAATSMHQLGLGTTGHISATGPARNPWDPERCAGGSSGGSAIAVACRAVAAAVGSDAGGSIRIPAAYCGITGLKPTWRRISVAGYTGGYSSLGVVGPMARDARDCALLFDALAGPVEVGSGSAVRWGHLPGLHWDDLQPEVHARCWSAFETLLDGNEPMSCTLEGEDLVVAGTLFGNAVERLPRLTPGWFVRHGDALHPTIRAIIKGHLLLPASVATRVTRLRTMLRRGLAEAFEHVDVLVSPTVPAIAPRVSRTQVELPSGRVHADLANLRLVGLANLTGVPAISIPCGFVEGLPVGLTLTARWGGEALLLELAERFEELTGRRYVDAGPGPATSRA